MVAPQLSEASPVTSRDSSQQTHCAAILPSEDHTGLVPAPAHTLGWLISSSHACLGPKASSKVRWRFFHLSIACLARAQGGLSKWGHSRSDETAALVSLEFHDSTDVC